MQHPLDVHSAHDRTILGRARILVGWEIDHCSQYPRSASEGMIAVVNALGSNVCGDVVLKRKELKQF